MSDTLSINLVPGYLPGDDELITPAILRAMARPTVTLEGSLGAAAIADGAVTTAKLADGVLSADTTGRNKMSDGFVTAAKLNATQDWSGKTITGNPSLTLTGVVNLSGATVTPPTGQVVNLVEAHTANLSTLGGGVGTGDMAAAASSAIPIDDTIPQNYEGAQLMTATITPKSATNLLIIEALIACHNPAAGATSAAALFQDTTASALAATHVGSGVATSVKTYLLLKHIMVAGTTSATTFKIRLGCDSGTITVNGIGGARIFGGVQMTRLTITEISA